MALFFGTPQHSGNTRQAASNAGAAGSAISLGEVRRPVLLFLQLLFGAVAAAQDAPADSPSSYAGRTIVRIDFDPPEQPIPRAELERLLPFHVGSALNPSAVRAALQKLYETGRFSNIAIDAQPSPDGAGAALKIVTERSQIGRAHV